MADPINFPSTTANFSLPLLFSGQAQKEFFVNQAISLLDGLMQMAVNESRPSPPTEANEGECYRITAPATDDWSGREDNLAVRLGSSWQYVPPRSGMRVFDRNIGVILHFDSIWNAAIEPTKPTGGTMIDAEARQAFDELVEALRMLGVFPDQS